LYVRNKFDTEQKFWKFLLEIMSVAISSANNIGADKLYRYASTYF